MEEKRMSQEDAALRKTINRRIDGIQERIDSGFFLEEALTVAEFTGADVKIRQPLGENVEALPESAPFVISLQESVPQKRVVRTVYSRELSWLLLELGEAFRETIDYVSKYDFFGSLAQAALDHLAAEGDAAGSKPLLLHVLARAREMVG
ncbi:MAG: hypothetical protein C4534_10015 [Gaiellales bacterium]|nr:MAG: hypothetical protein C4534_10015 [Gaiellales bacterium]